MLTSGNTPMIEAAGLSKFYGEFAAIRQVSFSVPQGQVAAFLGPNGAGCPLRAGTPPPANAGRAS